MITIFIKKRTYPLQTQVEEKLRKRLHERHPLQPILEEAIAKGKAGYKGEQNVDFYLDFLPSEKFSLFGDLRLPRKTYYFQIDTLVLTKSFILSIEIKNIRGKLVFDQDLNQFTQIYKNEQKRMTNPILQARRHQTQLRTLLSELQLSQVPIEYLFVNSNEEAIIDVKNGQASFFERITHAEGLLEKIYKLETKHREPVLSTREVTKLTKYLLKAHTPKEVNIEKYSFRRSDLIRGVFCPECGWASMIWLKNNAWNCPKCKHKSHTAHIPALEDAYYLISPEMTNRQCREFLKIDSPDTAKYLLKTSKLASKGSRRWKKYLLASLVKK